jgi:hypothetical protein
MPVALKHKMSLGEAPLLKPCLELGEQFARRGKGILGRAYVSRHMVETGRIIEHRQDLVACRGRGDPPGVPSQEARLGDAVSLVSLLKRIGECLAPLSRRLFALQPICGELTQAAQKGPDARRHAMRGARRTPPVRRSAAPIGTMGTRRANAADGPFSAAG